MPASTAIPTIVGKALVRQTLTAQTGRWSGMPSTFRFRWQRCAADRSRCRNVVGATSHRYRLVQRDIGSRIRVVVSASNLNGSSSTTAEATEVVRAAAPRATAAPTVTKIGRRLKAAPGRWIGLGKLRYSYSWQRCRPTLRTCTSIGGATGQHYRLTAADGGMHLRVIVRAASAGGSTRARSAVKRWRIGT